MNITLNADEIKTIIAIYFSIPQEDIRVGTIEIKKNIRVDHESMAVIKL